MHEFTMEIYRDGEELDLEEVPTDILNGIIVKIKEELNSRDRNERVWKKMLL